VYDDEDRFLHCCLFGFGLCLHAGHQACLQVRSFDVNHWDFRTFGKE
jgi:hypothetical protein